MCLALTSSVFAQVFFSEFFSHSEGEGWDLALRYCHVTTWNDQGWYYQQLDLQGCSPPGGGREAYSRSLVPYHGFANFFTEFRVMTDGDRSGIPYGVPIVLALGNNAGVLYHMTVAVDLVKFLRDVDLPNWYIDVEPRVPHTYRIELYPDRFAFYIDGYLIDEGVPEGPFLAYDAEIVWQGDSWNSPVENAWDYIRYGVTPEDRSGDFDSDAAITVSDLYFLHECITNERLGINGGPDNDAGPGCRFADFDADSDVDLLDLAEFQNLFNSP